MKLSGDNLALPPREELRGMRNGLSGLRMKQLMLVVALDHHRSIRKAAGDIHVSQPAASKSLIELEETLGVRLFERERTGLRLTDAGSCVVGHAKEMIRNLRRMHFDLDQVLHDTKKILRIGSIMGAVPATLAQCLRELNRILPDLIVTAEEGTSDTLMLQLRSGEVDLIFARSGHADMGGDIDYLPLSNEEVFVVAGLDHKLPANYPHDFAGLLQYPWIAYEPTAPLSSLLYHWCEQKGGGAPDVRLRTTSALITVGMLNESDCLALLPSAVFSIFGAESRLKRIQTSAPLCLGGYCAYWHKQSMRLDLLKLALQQLGKD